MLTYLVEGAFWSQPIRYVHQTAGATNTRDHPGVWENGVWQMAMSWGDTNFAGDASVVKKKSCVCTSDCSYLMEMQNRPNSRSVSHIVCTDIEGNPEIPYCPKTMLRPIAHGKCRKTRSCSLLDEKPKTQNPANLSSDLLEELLELLVDELMDFLGESLSLAGKGRSTLDNVA